jgi:hypothetical protein
MSEDGPTPGSDTTLIVVTNPFLDEFERIELRRHFEDVGVQRLESPLIPRSAVPQT